MTIVWRTFHYRRITYKVVTTGCCYVSAQARMYTILRRSSILHRHFACNDRSGKHASLWVGTKRFPKRRRLKGNGKGVLKGIGKGEGKGNVH